MITQLELTFGPSPGGSPIAFSPGPVTVFVGPNNSGKSLVLREIGSALFDCAPNHRHMINWEGHIPPDNRHVVRRLSVPKPEWARIRRHFENTDAMGMAYIGSLLNMAQPAGHINTTQFLKQIDQAGRPDLIEQARLMVLRSEVEILDGQRRLNLVDPRPSGNLRQPPANLLQALFRDDERRRRLAEMTKEAFGVYLVIDPTGGGQLQIAMSPECPKQLTKKDRCRRAQSASLLTPSPSPK